MRPAIRIQNLSKRFRLDRLKPLKPFKDKDAYQKGLAKAQKRLLVIQQAYLMQRRRAIIVFEGTDAAGKGGAIRRLTERLDPRFCKVWPTGAPNETERRQHYLQRFRLTPSGFEVLVALHASPTRQLSPTILARTRRMSSAGITGLPFHRRRAMAIEMGISTAKMNANISPAARSGSN